MNDYERVAAIIRFLDRHHTEQPNLAELARSVGLSQFHFHRLFSRWAGVTPKDFLQCLTLEHVKARLRLGDSVFDAALDAGLSGPGRAHDLCVTLEAASPGEMKNGGEGLRIDYGIADTPFGKTLIGETDRGICHLSFVDGPTRTEVRNLLAAQWPNAELNRSDAWAKKLSDTIFARQAGSLHLRGFVRATPFQLRVWRALLRVPPGSLTTYGRLSVVIQQPTAARAVGSAVGANPIAFIIPCHRVIRETGALGHYHWDPARKRAIVGWEIANRPLLSIVGSYRVQANAA